jgi:hypothetical protein
VKRRHTRHKICTKNDVNSFQVRFANPVKPLNYHDLLDAFALSGCPVCRLLHADSHRFLDLLLHENVMDGEIQQEFRRARLLCNNHAWQLMHFRGHAADIAVMSEAVLDELIRTLEGSTPGQKASRWLFGSRSNPTAEALNPQHPCLCCAHIDRMEHNYLDTLAAYFHDPIVQETYQVSEGLCLPHFRQFIQRLRTSAEVEIAVQAQINLWKILKDELGLFLIRTSHGNSDDQPIGAEGDSWKRAVRQIVGEKDIFGLRRGEDKR